MCLIALWEINMWAQGYFLDNTSATLEYVRKDASDGKIGHGPESPAPLNHFGPRRNF